MDNLQRLAIHSVQSGDIEVLKQLITSDQHLIHTIDENDDSLLNLAVINNQPQCVEFLLQCGAWINQTGCSSRTPLVNAVIENSIDCVRILLAWDSSIEETDSLEETVLHKAASTGNEHILLILLKHNRGLSAQRIINSTNVLGWTPLHNAADHGFIRIAEILIEHGANPTKEDDFGYKPSDIAFNKNHKSFGEFLLQCIDQKQVYRIDDAHLKM